MESDISKYKGSSSYILDDDGFTVVSNGKEPFFSLFPEQPEGFGYFLNEKERIREVFDIMSHADTLDALVYLSRRPEHYIFEEAVLAKNCEISNDRIETVMNDLQQLRVVIKQVLTINGEERTLYTYRSSHKYIALLLMAKETLYQGGHCVTVHRRKKPLLK